jgi:molecular chaperone GrpE
MKDTTENQQSEVKLTENQEDEAQKYKDLWLRAEAEMVNLKDRYLKDKTTSVHYALQKFVIELLPSIDNLRYALQQKEEAGNRMVLESFMNTFNKFDIYIVEPIAGEKFNPYEHEALTMQESDKQEHNTIISVLQSGYKLKDRLLRPSRVIIAIKHNNTDKGSGKNE